MHFLLGWLFDRLGCHADAREAAIEAWLTSFWYSATSMLSLMLLLMYAQGALVSFTVALVWLKVNAWPFFVAEYIAPFLRAHAAANLYAPIPPPKVFDAVNEK